MKDYFYRKKKEVIGKEVIAQVFWTEADFTLFNVRPCSEGRIFFQIPPKFFKNHP